MNSIHNVETLDPQNSVRNSDGPRLTIALPHNKDIEHCYHVNRMSLKFTLCESINTPTAAAGEHSPVCLLVGALRRGGIR